MGKNYLKVYKNEAASGLVEGLLEGMVKTSKNRLRRGQAIARGKQFQRNGEWDREGNPHFQVDRKEPGSTTGDGHLSKKTLRDKTIWF